MSFTIPQSNAGRSQPVSVTLSVGDGDALVPITPNIAAEVNRNPRTIKRWIKDEALGFPQPIRINNRLYVSRSAFEAWKRARFEVSLSGEAA